MCEPVDSTMPYMFCTIHELARQLSHAMAYRAEYRVLFVGPAIDRHGPGGAEAKPQAWGPGLVSSYLATGRVACQSACDP